MLCLSVTKSKREAYLFNMCYLSAAETLRGALALGADSGIHVQTDLRIDQDLQPLAVAKIFRKIMLDKAFDFAILGK